MGEKKDIDFMWEALIFYKATFTKPDLVPFP
jgi:hypothetical protein